MGGNTRWIIYLQVKGEFKCKYVSSVSSVCSVSSVSVYRGQFYVALCVFRPPLTCVFYSINMLFDALFNTTLR